MKNLTIFLILGVAGLFSAGQALADAAHSHMVNDPGFDQYVDSYVLEQALRSGDVSQLIDVAIQLYRGEKAMHRAHAGGSADDLFRRAWIFALQKQDQQSINRILSFLTVENRTDFVNQLKAIRDGGGIGTGAQPSDQDGIGTGAYPSDQGGIGTGAYPSDQGGIGTGAYPSDQGGIGTGAYPSDQGGIGTGAYPSDQGGIGTGAIPETQPLPAPPQGNSIHERAVIRSFQNQAEDAYNTMNQNEMTQLLGQVHSRSLNLVPQLKQQLGNYLEQIQEMINDRIAATSSQNPGNTGGVIGWGNQPAPEPQPSGPNGWGANGPDFTDGPVAPPENAENLYHCNSLKADFQHASEGALIKVIYPDSPLRGRLVEGDLILSLDNVKVRSTWELENHCRWTRVDYMSNTRGHQTTTIFIR